MDGQFAECFSNRATTATTIVKQRPPKPIDCDDVASLEEPRGFASPPCLRHEIDPAYGGDLAEADDPEQGALVESE